MKHSQSPRSARPWSSRRTGGGAVFGVALALLAASAQAQVSIHANITGTAPSAQANQDVQNALDFLATDFYSATPFTLTASINWAAIGGGTLGASSAGSGDFQNRSGVLYVNPLDRYVFGAASTVDTSASGYADFTISLDTGTNWDYTLSTPQDSSAYSLADVVYHEAIHSMGFASFTGANGAYDFGAPTVWSTKMYDAGTNQAFTADTQAQRASVIISGENANQPGMLLFTGAQAQAVNDGKGVRLYTPTTFENGSSDGSHISPLQPGAGLLYPALNNGVYLTPTAYELAMLGDLGWATRYSAGGSAPPSAPEPSQMVALSVGLLLLGSLCLRARRRAARI